MILDARRAEAPRQLDCDVCVVGAGAAGLAVALGLNDPSTSVCVLESGGIGYERSQQALLRGEMGDSDYPPLETVRTAGVGGCMRVWGGWCRPLDAVDFESRPDVPGSGWPFGLEELASYYSRAHELLDLGPYDYEPAGWEKAAGARRLPLVDGNFETILFRRSKADIAGLGRASFRRAPNRHLVLHATATRLRYTRDGRAAESVETGTLNGRQLEVRARVVVVAAGAIETARLLLLSAGTAGGPGNVRGLVGRYFLEHGYDDARCLVPENPRLPLGLYEAVVATGPAADGTVRAALAPSPRAIRRLGLLNCAIGIRPAYEADRSFRDPSVVAALELWDMLRSRSVPDRCPTRAWRAISGPAALARAAWCRLRRGRDAPPRALRLRMSFECAPDPDNRITLGAARDALGRRVARIQWRMREPELRSISLAYRILDAALRSGGVGRLEGDDGQRQRNEKGAMGEHHLGTTRMHADPSQGVVDPDLKVHGIDNLYVSGGSVFPTGGFANPGLTVVALALRLASHLSQLSRFARAQSSSSG
jgi:choline dehydrogenase-like flavoprotein